MKINEALQILKTNNYSIEKPKLNETTSTYNPVEVLGDKFRETLYEYIRECKEEAEYYRKEGNEGSAKVAEVNIDVVKKMIKMDKEEWYNAVNDFLEETGGLPTLSDQAYEKYKHQDID
jgi:hypothetical protein